MESPDSNYASFPEAPSKSLDRKDKPAHIRFLVSNMAAGCIIGKSGSTIAEIQSESGARIQLSRNHEFFLGTSDRMIVISGAIDDIMRTMELILEKLYSQIEESSGVESRFKVRLIVPNDSCGGIIGKGGSTIKSFIEDSQAGIKISPQDNTYVGLSDRIVTLTGSLDECLRATFLVMSRLMEDAHYSQAAINPYPYAGVYFSGVHRIPLGFVIPSVAYNTMNYVSNGTGGKYPSNKGMMPPMVSATARSSAGASEGPDNSMTIGVADEYIGAVVGRGGRNIVDIIQASAARIKISDRGDFISGTSDRKVTITGSREAMRNAEAMIMQKVSSVSER